MLATVSNNFVGLKSIYCTKVQSKPQVNSKISQSRDSYDFSFGKNISSVQKWEPIKALIVKQETVNGKKTFVNIEDFIKNGENSLLCKKIPVLKAIFSYRAAFKDYQKSRFTVGSHTQIVMEHLINQNEEFIKASQKDKEMLLTVGLFHDIGKIENVVKRNLLVPSDMENMEFKGTEFDKTLKSKIDELKIFNPFNDYKKVVINYFKNNPHLDEAVLHNNIHRYTSADMFDKNFAKTSKNEAELGKLKFLIEHHQDMGEQNDCFRYGYISREEFEKFPQKLAKNISDHHDLELTKIFHISDANGVIGGTPKEHPFFILLNEIVENTHKAIDEIKK